ncbi:MAG: hypothetical protein ACLTDR_09355 [Adlercreutzia equolifaciens]
MRFFGSMLNIGVVTMITLSGYSFLTAGLSSSLIALSIFVVTPRVSKRIDERGQSAVVPKAAAVSLLGLAVLIANVAAARAGMAPVRRSAAGGVLPESPGHGPRPVTYLIRSGRLGEAAPDLRTMFSYESVLDDMAFIFSPSISIALAAAIAPVAGMVCGGVAFAVGVVLLCTAKSTEPHPGWSQAGAAGNDADIVDVADAADAVADVAGDGAAASKGALRRGSGCRRFGSVRAFEESACHLRSGARAVRDLRLRRVVPRPVRYCHSVAFRGLEQPRFRRRGS